MSQILKYVFRNIQYVFFIGLIENRWFLDWPFIYKNLQ